MENKTYVTIYEGAMMELGLNVKQYYLAEVISLLSGKKSITPGWCVMSKAKMAKKLGVSESGVYVLLDKLEEKQLIERKGKYKSEIRITKKWSKIVDELYKNKSLHSSESGHKSNSKKKSKKGENPTKESGKADPCGKDVTSVIVQRYIDIFIKHNGFEPIISYADKNRIKEALKYLTAEQLIEYLEARANDGSISLDDALNLSFALSSGALNKWRAEICE